MPLDRLVPELQGRDLARTDGGMVLLRQPKGCLLVLTAQEYATGIGRGKGILRARKFNARLQAEQEKAGEKWLRRIFDRRGFITAKELLEADLGNGPDDLEPQRVAQESEKAPAGGHTSGTEA